MKNFVGVFLINSIENFINKEENISFFQCISFLLSRYITKEKSKKYCSYINLSIFAISLLIWSSYKTIPYLTCNISVLLTPNIQSSLIIKKRLFTSSLLQSFSEIVSIVVVDYGVKSFNFNKRLFVILFLIILPISFCYYFLALLNLLFLLMLYGTIIIIRNFNLFDGLKMAFIADGNRRYLRKYKLKEDSVKYEGLEKIYELINFCMILKIKEVGFYCFSIKNFNRPSSEIANLFSIITDNEFSMQNVKPKFMVYGRLNLLPNNVSKKLEKLMEATKNNTDITVNIFIAYSTTDEVQNGEIFNEDVDILIRSSGEKRLSDFLIRQCCRGTNIFFTTPLWPELSIFHVFFILVKYKLENYLFFKTRN